MKTVLGILFSNMHEHMVSELTTHRCMGSIPVGGRYRLIDFALSGFANSGIEQVGVITKSNYQSLMDHLGSGRDWDLARKNGGLVILPPFGRGEAGMYRGRVEALAGIMGYIRSNQQTKYVIAADCDIMANIDFTDFMNNHIESGADISVMYKKINMDETASHELSVFLLGKDNQIQEMLINPQITGTQNVYLNIMMISRKLLEQVIDDTYSRNLYSFEKDVLQAGLRRYHINAYEFTGYVSRFDSMQTYYASNMALLDAEARRELFPKERPIYTKILDHAPVRYGLDARVNGSLLADGCVVEGEVENSILFRGVRVGKGAKVKNSILMQNTTVGDGASLDCIIADKDVVIQDERVIIGYNTYPVYIAKGFTV